MYLSLRRRSPVKTMRYLKALVLIPLFVAFFPAVAQGRLAPDAAASRPTDQIIVQFTDEGESALLAGLFIFL